MNEWIEAIKEAWDLLSDAEKDFLKNCGLLAMDTKKALFALREGGAFRTIDAIGASNHIKAFFELATRIKDQKERNFDKAWRTLINGKNIKFDGKNVIDYYSDNEMIDIFRDVMKGRCSGSTSSTSTGSTNSTTGGIIKKTNTPVL